MLSVKDKLSIRVLLYIVSSWQRCIPNKGYSRHWSVAQKVLFKLPTKNGEIDFAFMESFIAELEAERIAELEAYLIASGLKDYTLTKDERKVLAEFENGNIAWGNFFLGGNEGIFDVVGTKSLDSNAIEFTDTGINFVGRTFENNGIQGKIQKRDFEPNNPFTITATVIGNYKYVKYQQEPYYCSQNINKLTPKSHVSKWSKKIAYYFVTNVQKFVSLYDGQQGGYKLPDIKNHIIKLPQQNSQPDYEKMETFISAIQKLVIKDVVLYLEGGNLSHTK